MSLLEIKGFSLTVQLANFIDQSKYEALKIEKLNSLRIISCMITATATKMT